MRFHLAAFRLVLALVVLAAAGAAVLAAGPPALPEGVQKHASVEGITEYELTNGLRVLLFPDRSKETATVNVTYLVGSRHEGYGETGMAHLLEHLVFKGTPGHPDIPGELTQHGTRPNGSTWFDRTNYFETFAATDENLDWALDLEADRMVNSFIAKKDLDSEMTVVRNEFEIGENYPQAVLLDRILATAYLWHGYGRSTIGARADIERVPIDNLQAFYRKWYQPDNAVLVVAGRFDEARTLEKILATFGRIPRPSRTLPRTWTTEPPQDGERSVALRRVGDAQMVGVAYHVPAGAHPDFAAVDLLAFILGDTPSGRLHEALVETGKAASITGFAWQLAEPGVLLLNAEVRREKSLDEARDAILRVVDGLAAQPPSAAEVARARESRLREWEQTMRDSETAAILLSEWAAMGDWRLMFLHRDRIEATTPEDVRRVAAAYLRPENRTVGLYIPSEQALRAEIPASPDVAALVKDYKGRESLAAGESFDPAPGAIEKRLVRRELDPGIKLVMLPKETRGDLVQVALDLHFGDELSLAGRRSAAELCGEMLLRGTESRTREQIQDELDRLRATLNVHGAVDGASATLEVGRAELPAALGLLADVLRRPAFPAAELEQLRQERLLALEDSRNDPFQVAITAFRRHLDPWPSADPRYTPTPEEQIEATRAVRAEDVRAFHADFYGASAAEIAIVGDFDAAAVERQVAELLGGWKSRRPYARLAAGARTAAAIERRIETPDKESAVFIGGQRLGLRDDEADYAALVLGNFMTGGGFLNSRLATRLRQKEGLSYGAGSSFSASSWDKDAHFLAYAIYAPQNSTRLTSAFKEEITKILSAGFTGEELAEAKSGWLQSRRVSRAQDAELAATLTDREFTGRTLAWDERLEKSVAELSPPQLLEALRRHLDLARMALFEAGDFARAAAPQGQPTPGGAPPGTR